MTGEYRIAEQSFLDFLSEFENTKFLFTKIETRTQLVQHDLFNACMHTTNALMLPFEGDCCIER